MTTDPFEPLAQMSATDTWDEIGRRAQEPAPTTAIDLTSDARSRHRLGTRALMAAAAVVTLVMISVAAFGTDGGGTVATDKADITAASPVPETEPEPITPTEPPVATTTAPPPPPTTQAPPTTEPSDAPAPTVPPVEEAPTPTAPALTVPESGNRVLTGPCAVHFTGGLPLDVRHGPSPDWSLATGAYGTGPYGPYGSDEKSNTVDIDPWDPVLLGHGELLDGSIRFEMGLFDDFDAADMLGSLYPTISDPNGEVRIPAAPGGWPGAGKVLPARMDDPTKPRRFILPPVPTGRAAVVGFAWDPTPHPTCPYRYVYFSAVGEPGMDQYALARRIRELVPTLRPGTGS